MNEYSFTLNATFAADSKQDAWDMFVEWLTNPMNVEDGTEVVEFPNAMADKHDQFRKLLDTYEAMHGIIPGGPTADYLWQAAYGPRFTDQEWDQLPGPVRDVLDPGSHEARS